MKVLSYGLLALLLLCVQSVAAHQSRLAYLDIKALPGGQALVNWTRPLVAGQALGLQPVFPAPCAALAGAQVYALDSALLQRWTLACGEGLAGLPLRIAGLDATLASVLVHYEAPDGAQSQTMLDSDNNDFVLPRAAPSGTDAGVGWAYFRLGVAHILSGVDHLLFVLCLLFVAGSMSRALTTVTAFTLAHSLTLASAVLGLVQVPSAFVEAAIALSILTLAAELAREPVARRSARSPWLIAFVFGLLHGLGFAGALAELGLPSTALPLALLTFNLGVEVGQVVFIGVALLAAAFVRPRAGRWLRALQVGGRYAIGATAAFWLIQRVVAFY